MAPTRAGHVRRTTGLVAVVALLGAGCGSTVQAGGQLLGSGTAGTGPDGLSLATGDGLTPGSAAPDSSGTSGPSAGSGSTAPGAGGTAAGGGSSTSAGAPGTSAASAAQRAGQAAPGVTDKEIFIGVAYTPNSQAANAAIGAAGITSSDQKANAQAVIDEVNARGGVAGRKLVPVWHAYDAQSSQTPDSQDQAACSTFTQDNKVFAASGGLTENFSACMERAGVLQVDSGRLIDRDRVFFDKYPNLFDVGTMSQDRMMAEEIAALSRLGYFSGWDATLGTGTQARAKVGILSYDDPSWNRPLDRVMLPGLGRAGYPVDPSLVYRVYKPVIQTEMARTAGEVQNAIVRFRQSGVTHVILLDASGTLTIAYAAGARNQRYLPRLGVNSASGMQALYDSKVLDAQQLNGAVGLGWFPSIDLPAGQGDRYLSGAAKQCRDIIQRRTGQTFTSTNAASLALVACDQIFLVATAINRTGGTVTRNTTRAALEALGGGFTPALIPAALFSPSRHDGLQRGFDMAWDSQCGCTQYRDAGHDIP